MTTKDMEARIDAEFRFASTSVDQAKRQVQIRNAAKEFARILLECTPPSADQSAALRKLRECVMTANAAITCQ